MTQPTDATSAKPEVVFYVLKTDDVSSRETFTAKLLQKVYKEKRQADVLFANESEAQRFDLTLWNFRPQAFIPHAYAHEVAAPIQLFGSQISQPSKDVLLNLHPEFQNNYAQYQRTIEILDNTPHLIEKGRERFRQYRALGIEPTVHKIN